MSDRLLEAIQTKLRHQVAQKFKEIFGESNINAEQIAELEAAWPNFEPVITLAARFQGDPEWQEEIKSLGDIFQAVLDNRFEDYKFGDLTQLEGLSDQQKADWKKTYTALRVVTPEDCKRADQQRTAGETISGIIRNNLGPHSETLGLGLADGNLSVNQINQEWPTANQDRKTKILGEIIFKAVNRQDPQQKLPWINLALKLLPELNAEGVTKEQVITDLKNLRQAITTQPQELRSDVITVTTTTWDPYTLLTVGDIVKGASSCQNYKNGSVVETLPGYVMDGNVQALLGFVVEAGDFVNQKDFNDLKRAIPTSRVQVEFIGPQRKIRFIFDEKTRETKPLPTAYIRQMVKVGKTEAGKAGLVMEDPYVQSSPALPLLKEQQKQVLGEIAGAMGATTDESITVKASRNPRGHYSDLNFGAKTDDYTIAPH